jgi:hypothetical protein
MQGKGKGKAMQGKPKERQGKAKSLYSHQGINIYTVYINYTTTFIILTNLRQYEDLQQTQGKVYKWSFIGSTGLR